MILGPNSEPASLRVDADGRLLVTLGPQDLGIVNHVESGLLPPASGAIAGATLSAGVAYVEGARVALPATPLTLTATRDNYIDLRRDNTVIVTPVTVAAAAPAVPVNSMRLGFVRTDATTVTARTIQAFDSLGNWMYNVVATPLCKATRVSANGYGGAPIALQFPDADVFDNANMHSPTVDNTRFVLPYNGAYQIECSLIWFAAVTPGSAFTLAPRITDPVLGVIADPSFPEGYQGTQATMAMRTSGVITGRAGQYVEMIFTPNGSSGAIDVTRFSIQRIR